MEWNLDDEVRRLTDVGGTYDLDEEAKRISAISAGKNDDDNILQAAYYGLLSATGNMIHTAQDAVTRSAKPDNKSDEEWRASQPWLVKKISQFGHELEDDHKRDYSSLSANRIASGVSGVAPYAIGLGAATVAAGKSGNYQMIGQTANQAVRNIGIFGKYTPQVAKAAEVLAPAATVDAIRTVPEAGLEWQGAYDDYIGEAKRDGTYVQGETEKKAEEISNAVFRDNMALLGGTNLLETLALTTKLPLSKIKSAMTKIMSSAAMNAGEEMAQQIFPKAEGGKPYSLTDDDVLEAGVIGAIAGAGTQGAGMAADHFLSKEGSLENPPNMSKDDFFGKVATQESGGDYSAQNGRTGAFGKYQIMPDNWPSWSKEAGLSDGAEMTPENQEVVARYKLGDYFDKYGPEGALVAWYSGEGNAQRWIEGKPTAIGEGGEYSWDARQGKGDEPSIREYVSQALGRDGVSIGDRSLNTDQANLNTQATEQENDFFNSLINEKIESLTASNDLNNSIEDYNFLTQNKNDKEAIVNQYPDIAEKMEQYRQEQIPVSEERAPKIKDMPSRKAAIQHMIKQGHIEFDSPYLAERFKADSISKGFTESKAGDKIRFTAPQDFASRADVQQAGEQNVPPQSPVSPSDTMIQQEAVDPVQETTAQNVVRPAHYGAAVRDLAARNHVRVEPNTLAGLRANNGLAIDRTVRALKEAGVSLDEIAQYDPKVYAKELLDFARDNGAKPKYGELSAEIERNAPNATKILENMITSKGFDMGEIKYSFDSRHDKDRQRMKEQQKAVDNYMPDRYKGEASGVVEGLAEHEIASIENYIQNELGKGKAREDIERQLKVSYNRIKSNKSDGMSTDKKLDFMKFLQGAISRVRDEGRTLSGIHGDTERHVERGDERGHGESVQKNDRVGNDGSGVYGTDSKINQKERPSEGAFSMPGQDKIKYSAEDRHELDRQRMREQQKAVDELMTDEFKGEMPGYAYTITPEQVDNLRQKVFQKLESGIEPDIIYNSVKTKYNQVKANKSDGLKEQEKLRILTGIKGVMYHVEESIRSRVPDWRHAGRSGFNDTNDGRDNTGRRSSGMEYDGQGQAGSTGSNESKINQKERPSEGAFSMPEKDESKYSADSILSEADDDIILGMMSEQHGNMVSKISEGQLTETECHLADVGEEMGCRVVYFNAPSNMHGFHVGNTTFMNRNSSRPGAQTFWHESFHWIRNNNGKLYDDLVSFINEHAPFSKKQIADYRKTIFRGELRNEDGSYAMAEADVIEEMLADKMADVAGRLGLSRLLAKKNPSLYERFVGWVNGMIQHIKRLAADSKDIKQAQLMEQKFYQMATAMRTHDGKPIFRTRDGKLILARTGEAVGSDTAGRVGDAAVAYSAGKGEQSNVSLKKEVENFSRLLDQWKVGNLNPRDMLHIGSTPEILCNLGAKQLPVVISQKVVAKVVNPLGKDGGKHGLAFDLLKQLPEQIHDPVMVFDSKTVPGNKVVLTELIDQENRPVIVAVHLVQSDGRRYEANHIASVYGRNNGNKFIMDQIAEQRLLYPIPHNKKSLAWIRSRGLQLPSDGSSTTGSFTDNSIPQNKNNTQDSKKDDVMYSFSNDKEENSGRVGDAAVAYSADKGENHSKFKSNSSVDEINSMKADKNNFERQLNQWRAGNIGGKAMLKVCTTPNSLINIGAKKLPILISQKTLAKIVNPEGIDGGKHNLSFNLLKQLPQEIYNPVMIFESKTVPGNKVLLTELVDDQNRPVISAIHLSECNGHNEANHIASVYGRNNGNKFILDQIIEGRLLYQNKEKSQTWMRSRGLQLPNDYSPSNGSFTDNSIPQNKNNMQDPANKLKFSMTNESTNPVNVQENIRRGTAAMEEVISEHVDVENAMRRDDVGTISFYWGEPGRGAKFKKGRGISHIIAKRDFESGTGEQTARKMVEVLAKGNITAVQRAVNEQGEPRVKIGYGGYTAVLSLKEGEDSSWLLTGWEDNGAKKEVSNATGEGYDSTRATTNTPTLTRHVGADTSFIKNSIPQSEKNMQDSKKDDILYSFSNDDHHSSLMGKIKNVFSSGRASHPISRSFILRSLEDLGNVKIAFGKLSGDEAVVFKEVENVIRAKKSYEWETLLPKIGHAIAKRLKIDSAEPMQNYIADWFLTGAVNNTSKEASAFADAMKMNPAFAEKMMETQELFEEWNGMDAMRRGQAMISFDKPAQDTKSLLTRAIYTIHDQFIEELGPVKRMVRDIEKQTGKLLSMAGDPYVALRLFRGHFGKAMAMIEGSEMAVKALKNVFPSINFDGFKTVNLILRDANALHDKARMKDFITYATAKHIKDIHAFNQSEASRISEAIRNEYAKMAQDGVLSDDEYAKMEKVIERKQKDALMETPFSEKDCDEIIRNVPAEFVLAQKDLVHYSNTLAAILADSGVIGKKRYQEMKNRWKNYVPLFRVFEENEEVNFGDSTKHMTGSARDLINPLEGIIKNTYAFIKAAEKNKAKAKLGMVARMSDVGEYIESVDNAMPDGKSTISYFVDGERRYLKTDPDIVKAVNSMGMEASNWFLKAFRFPTQLARATATILNPEFAIRNLFRDVGDAVIYSKYGFTPADFVRGFMHAIKKDELYYEFIASGAGQASVLSMDRNYTQATIDKMTKTWKQEALSTRGILNALQAFGEYSEYGTRIGAYEKARKAEQAKAKLEGKREDISGITEAALESRDLMDFARGGAASRSWNQTSMFANVSIQGWNKFFRTFDFSDPKQAKHAKSAALRLFFTAALPAMALWMMNHDDDRYKEIPDWQKEKHWILFLGDKIFRIPKGQDVGIQLFSNWIEKGLSAAYDKDPLTLKKILNPIEDMLPSSMPTAVLPVMEAAANYSFFTEGTIVPRYQENLPDKLQYGMDTTSLAKFVGEQTGLSPRKVEHVLFGYTGGLGKAIPNTYDYLADKKQLNTSIEDLPIFRGVMIVPYKNSKTIADYYEAADTQMKLYNELKSTGKKPDDFDPNLYGRIKAATPAMQRLSKFERLLADNKSMPVGEKRLKQEELQQRRIAIAKKVIGS